MELEKVSAEIRPRSEWEAIDLGLSLTRANIGRIFRGWMASVYPVCLLILLVCWLGGIGVGWGIFLIWWLKPVWERVALHPLSRHLFGEQTGWRDALKVLPQELMKQKLLVILGLLLTFFGWVSHNTDALDDDISPDAILFWLVVLGVAFYRSRLTRSLLMPIKYLEGLEGTRYSSRATVISQRSSGGASGLTFICLAMEIFIYFSQFQFLAIMIPEGVNFSWELIWGDFFEAGSETLPSWFAFVSGIVYLNALSVTAWFYIGGGFGLYVNSRTWTEGWDIELNFKKIGQRLGILLLALGLFSVTPEATAATTSEQERAGEVLSDGAFDVKTRKIRESKGGDDSSSSGGESFSANPGAFAAIGQLIFYTVLAAAIGALIWLIVKNAHIFRRIPSENIDPEKAKVTTVAGMNIAPECLPSDVLASARRLWEQGKYQEALGLLYRGAISSLVTRQLVEIEESDTEMDCLRRVRTSGEKANSTYFQLLTGAWMSQAYGKQRPAEDDMERLWSQWPFSERRGG